MPFKTTKNITNQETSYSKLKKNCLLVVGFIQNSIMFNSKEISSFLTFLVVI